MKPRPRSIFSDWDPAERALTMTADEFPPTDDENLDTGLLDASGTPIRRPSKRIPMGFCRKEPA